MPKNLKVARLAGILVLSGCLLSAACARREEKQAEEPRRPEMAAVRSICIGRFKFRAPDTLTDSGRGQGIYNVGVDTSPIPPGGPRAAWNERTKAIGSLPPPGGAAQAILKDFEIQPGAPSVWYYGNSGTSSTVNLIVMKPMEDHLLWLDREAAAGKESIAEGLVKEVLNGYVSGASYGFCVGPGAIVLEPSQSEFARMTLVHRTAEGFRINFETRTVQEPDLKTYSSLDEEQESISQNGGTMRVLKNEERGVGALMGREIRISVAPKGQPPFARFTWHFPGVSGSSSQPKVTLVGTSRAAQQTELERAWEEVLGSLRPFSVSRP